MELLQVQAIYTVRVSLEEEEDRGRKSRVVVANAFWRGDGSFTCVSPSPR